MKKLSAKQVGDYGENLAEKYLKRRGWHILSRNFRARGGEIDIIGFRLGRLVYFEVKTRSNDKYGTPAQAVDGDKVWRIESAAKEFTALYCWGGKVAVFNPLGVEKKRKIRKQRIDVMEVYLNDKTHKIKHIKNWGSTL